MEGLEEVNWMCNADGSWNKSNGEPVCKGDLFYKNLLVCCNAFSSIEFHISDEFKSKSLQNFGPIKRCKSRCSFP